MQLENVAPIHFVSERKIVAINNTMVVNWSVKEKWCIIKIHLPEIISRVDNENRGLDVLNYSLRKETLYERKGEHRIRSCSIGKIQSDVGWRIKPALEASSFAVHSLGKLFARPNC